MHLDTFRSVGPRCMVAERIILDVWSSVAVAATQEEELLRRQLEELNARMDDVRQHFCECFNERGSDGTHRSCENYAADGVKTAPRGHESGEA